MLTKRIIPCLDVKNGRVVKGTNFVGLRDAGDGEHRDVGLVGYHAIDRALEMVRALREFQDAVEVAHVAV